MDRDRNLLFGILAVQLKGVSPAQMVEAAAAWTTDPSVPLAQRLVDLGLLKPPDRQVLEGLVDEAVQAHGGDAQKTLQAFGGEEQVHKTFSGTLSSAELDAMQTSPMTGFAFFTPKGTEVSGVEEARGRYTLVSHHAKGGMGRVLLVHDEYLGRNIALKELLPIAAGDESDQEPSAVRHTASVVARFLQEARVTGQLEHPSIVPVYELGRRQDGTLYYTMKLVRGKTLGQALRDCKDLSERLALLANFIDLCQAIAYAHSRGVIHRDVKPGNVMVGQFGETVVLDWGLAKVRDSEDVHTEEIEDTLHFLRVDDEGSLPKTAYGRALGTPHYMPPEQAEGRIDAIDERSDVYSLGAVLYEILTGTTPFSGKNTRDILHKVMHDRPTPVLEAVPDAPPELAGICEKAIQRDSKDRYQSAMELAEDVRRFITGSLVQAYRYSLGEILRRYYRKHRPVVTAVAAFLVLLLAGGIYSYVSILNARNREHDQRLVAEEKTYLSQLHLAQTLVTESDYRQANELLWRTDPQKRGWPWGYLLNRANPELLTVETPGLGIHGAFFTPDGSKIVTLSMPELSPVWDARTGAALATLEGQSMYYTSCVFSPDGSKVAAGGLEGVCLWDVASGKRLLHVRVGSGVFSVAFDKAGSQLFAGGGDKVIRIWDIASGKLIRELATESSPVYFLRFEFEKQRMVAGMGEVGRSLVQVWSLPDFHPLFSVPGLAPCLSADGALLAVVDGPVVASYALDTGSPLGRMDTGQELVRMLRFSANGARLVSCANDGTVEIWDAMRGEQVSKFSCQEPVHFAFFVDNDRFVLAGTINMKLSLWPVDGEVPVYVIQARGPGLLWAELAPDGRRVALATGDQFLQVWNAFGPTGMQPAAYHRSSDPMASPGSRHVRFCSSKERFGVSWEDNTVAVFDSPAMSTVTQYLCPGPFTADLIVLSPDGRRALTLVDSCTPIVWDVDTGSLLYAYRGHDAPVRAVAWSPDGQWIVSGALDGVVHVWEAASGRTERTLQDLLSSVLDITFSPDSTAILTGSVDKTAALWSVQDGQRTATFQHMLPVVSVAFNEHGDRIAATTSDANVHIWDASHGVELGLIETGGYVGDYLLPSQGPRASFTPDDLYVVTRGRYANTRLWDVASCMPRATFDVNEWVELQSDGRTAIAVNANGVIRRVEAAAWSREQLPGPTGGIEWWDQYRDYRLQQAQTTPVIRRLPDKETFFVAVSTEVLAGTLTAFLEDVNAADSEAAPLEKGLPVVAGSQQQWTFRLGLQVGDCITQADGKPLATLADARGWLQHAIRASAESNKMCLGLTILRADRTMHFEYRTLPAERKSLTLTLSREAAVGLLNAELALLPHTEIMCQYSPPGIAYLAIALGTAATEEDFRVSGFWLGDVVMEFDGRRFSTYEPLKQYLVALRRRIETGETVEFSQHVLRGLFRELDIAYTLNPDTSSR